MPIQRTLQLRSVTDTEFDLIDKAVMRCACYLDLIVNEMLYELRVAAALAKEHQAQALHYAMLQDIRRVKLIKFGANQVQGKLLRNAVTESDRHQPTMHQRHLEVLLEHVTLDGIQWLNLNHSRLEVTTVERRDKGMGTRELTGE